ncbi:MAG: hypothetical protein M1434_00510 [Chloroflexi bacterium]|nr:hypothetical protein [Chloroflexota bacterium]
MRAKKPFVFLIVFVFVLGAVFTTQSTASANNIQGGNIVIPCGGSYMPLDRPVFPGIIFEPCGTLPLVRGWSFLDANANGKWDAGETVFGQGWYKVTDGGAWFTCGWVGDDSTFGVPVNPGTYYVLPVAPKGYKTTTPRIEVSIGMENDTPLALMGFVTDTHSVGDACDQYNPPRS